MPISALRPLDQTSDSVENLAREVYESLMSAILSGKLQPGDILSAVKVSEQLNVSRTPVQQALRHLDADGLVEVPIGRRARVASFSPDDLRNIFEMRVILEGPATERATNNADPSVWVPLRTTLEELATSRNTGDWIERWTEFDDQFHHVIAEQSGNPLLAREIDRYRLLHGVFNRTATDLESLGNAMDEHRAILDALEAGDAITARVAMEHHIQNWQNFFAESMVKNLAPAAS